MATTQTVLNADGGMAVVQRRPPRPQASSTGREIDISLFGTFADSKTAPIHRWFQYPAGFSFRAVEYALDSFGIVPGQRVYDPFTGTGTTEVTCKARGIASGGTEAHPFVVRIAQTKARWDYDYSDFRRTVDMFLEHIQRTSSRAKDVDLTGIPELVKKCYTAPNLRRLCYVRDQIRERVPKEYLDVFEVALIGTLRVASGAATGWPYIAPNKHIEEKDGIDTFSKQINFCLRDLSGTPQQFRTTPTEIVEGDCRRSLFGEESFDFAFTSPPYLNNYDYADRTRLESYFTQFVKSWSEITEKVRDHLIVSATTQVSRTDFETRDILCRELKAAEPQLAKELQTKVDALSTRRLEKGGKKSYDIMVGQYFNDMTLSIADTFRILKPGSKYVLILGDSAPYGIHIPTETYLGRIAIGLGFRRFSVTQMRVRGNKWKANPQRHQVPLRESLLILEK